MADYLLVISEQSALAWILEEQAMAFSERSMRRARSLEVGDRLLLYTTSRCFHLLREPGRVIGEATVTSPAERMKAPLRLGDREFPHRIGISVKTLAPLRTGVELAPLVDDLAAFRGTEQWKFKLWSTLVPLPREDVARLRSELKAVVRTPSEVTPAYIERGKGSRPLWKAR